MCLSIAHRPGGEALHWSKVEARQRGSLTRLPRTNRRISCNETSYRWSPVEEEKQKVQQLEKAVEHKMPDTQNL